MAFVFRVRRSDEPPGRELLAAVIAHLDEIYPGRSTNPGSVTTPGEMAPHNVFLVGYEDGEPIAIGDLRPLPEAGVCEIKRMFVVPRALARCGAGAAGRAGGRGARARLLAGAARCGPEQKHSRLSSRTRATSRSSATTTTT